MRTGIQFCRHGQARNKSAPRFPFNPNGDRQRIRGICTISLRSNRKGEINPSAAHIHHPGEHTKKKSSNFSFLFSNPLQICLGKGTSREESTESFKLKFPFQFPIKSTAHLVRTVHYSFCVCLERRSRREKNNNNHIGVSIVAL